ncbi:MAG: hypothetical protein WD379_08400 [Dehalococcoidia bacterium]
MPNPFQQSRDEGNWRAPAAFAALVVLAVHALWTLAPPVDGDARHLTANLFIDGSVALALFLVTMVAMRYRGSRLGAAWLLLALGLALSLFAEVSWSAQEMLVSDDVPFPSVSDIGYVGAYFPILAGLLLMPQAPARGAARLKLALDALIVTCALAVLSWVLIAESILGDTDQSFSAQAVSLFYPLADLAVVFAAFVLVARAGRRFALAFGLLAAGYVATAFADSAYAYLTEAGYSTGSYADIGWVAGYTLLSLAALAALDPMAGLEPNRHGEASPAAFWPSLLPYVAMLPLAVLLLEGVSSDTVDPTLTAGFLAVASLVVVRQIVANYENVWLNRELRSLNANLEFKVREKTIELFRRSGRGAGDGDPEPAAPNPHTIRDWDTPSPRPVDN